MKGKILLIVLFVVSTALLFAVEGSLFDKFVKNNDIMINEYTNSTHITLFGHAYDYYGYTPEELLADALLTNAGRNMHLACITQSVVGYKLVYYPMMIAPASYTIYEKDEVGMLLIVMDGDNMPHPSFKRSVDKEGYLFITELWKFPYSVYTHTEIRDRKAEDSEITLKFSHRKPQLDMLLYENYQNSKELYRVLLEKGDVYNVEIEQWVASEKKNKIVEIPVLDIDKDVYDTMYAIDARILAFIKAVEPIVAFHRK